VIQLVVWRLFISQIRFILTDGSTNDNISDILPIYFSLHIES